MKSLLQGVRLPALEDIDSARVLHELCDTIRENFAPPSWIEYREDVNPDGRIHFTISRWGWDD